MSLFEELKRRNVFRVGIAYVLMGWVLLQGADFVLDVAGAPDWVIRTLVSLVALGLPVTLFFAWAFEVTPEGIKREKDVDRSASVTPETGRKLDRAIIVFLAIAVVLLLADRFFVSQDSAPRTATAVEGPAGDPGDETGAPPKSVAVLPFADLSQGGDQAWFADGLAEEILNALAKTPDLLVASRTSSFAYKGMNTDILVIAKELGVAHVLEGSVRSTGERIRVTAQLIRAEDGFHVWSENYDRSPEDMIAIQEDLALSIAEALETTMDPDALAAMAQVGTRSVEAYKAYLRGVADEGSRPDGASLLEALAHYEAAAEADPRFASAYLRQAAWWKGQLTPSYLLSGATDLSVEGLMERFTAAIDAAIANAAGESDRMGYLAQKAEVEVRLRDAIERYEAYLEQRPNDLPALLGLASTVEMANDEAARQRVYPALRERGRRDVEAAIAYLSSAYDVVDPGTVADYGLERLQQWPDNRGVLYQTHRALMWAGRVEEGASLLRRYELNFEPSPLMRIRQACIEGRREDAERDMATIERGDDDQWRTTAWLGLKMLGRDEEAAPLLDPIADSSSPYQIASMLSYNIFDPRPYPELMTLLDREGVLRPAPKELPYKCPPPDDTSIAVLPFVNMSSDPEQEFFSDGISEEILNALAQVPDLKVAGRTSSFAFKGRNEDLRTIGNALGVNHILEGSVRKAGDRVRITAQLIKADDGFHLWSETFDRELTDVFAIQDEIAAAILTELEAQLLNEEVTEVDLAAYEQFLQARQLMLQRSEAALTEAAQLLDDVIRTAPEYAPAYAERAIVELLLSDEPSAYGDIPIAEAAAFAMDLADRAIALDPDLAGGYAARGFAASLRKQYEAAIRDLEQALSINPNHVNANHWLKGDYQQLGRLREARQLAEKVHQLDPLFVPGIGGLASIHYMFGEPERIAPLVRGAAPYLQGAAKDYLEGIRAFGLHMMGDRAEAIRLVEQLPPESATFGYFVTFRGFMELMEPERALPYSEDRPFRMLALSRLGRTEEALQYGTRFLANGNGIGATIQVLASAERFEDIVEFVETRYESLEEFARLNGSGGFGADELGHVAFAYRQVGREAEAERTMTLFREELERQRAAGADNDQLSFSLAQLAMLERDEASALDHLERATQQGMLRDADFTRYHAAFRPLRGDPRFEALVLRMNEVRNAQRALLDLPPIEAGP